ncbi:DUF6460 domain-containing protein [Amorphus orientalis]|uniref:DUF6460 domain-containing protein n=1 Tax=Amorphus orientalis TaxID=649198 RepID=A0AAE3VMA4_9HYPH|nr:DUF6460 domain-containing protein [Amorphus orientalis]MDQ0314657.1 hypothetical protein [Amorphus orientalis]
MVDQPSRTRRLLGGSFPQVILKLLLLSFLVGLVLASLGFTIEELVFRISLWIGYLPQLGWSAIVDAGRYLALGAIIVVPIWLIVRVLENVRS